MGYEVHLERRHSHEISFQEWRNAVDNHPLVRMSQNLTHRVANPVTGQQIGRLTTPGDAEIWIENTDSWVFALRWQSGRVLVKVPSDFDNRNSFLRKLLRALAVELNAALYGEEGEEYD